jgi:hypothetical protein
MAEITNNMEAFFTVNGDETDLSNCDYAQIKLLGPHAKEENACMLISKSDILMVINFSWYLGKDGYPVTYSSTDKKIKFGRGLKIHRFLERNVQKGMVVDHINRNRLDNRRENLRICTAAENSYNKTKVIKKNNNIDENDREEIDDQDNKKPKKVKKIQSKYKGVRQDNKTEWSATITKDGKKYEMKHLPDEITAAKMYDIMSEELFGNFSAKNNPVEPTTL